MPFLIRSSQVDYISNKEKDTFFVSESDENEYDFKYVPANHFKRIVKNVQRQRCKDDEDRIWATFVNQQELNGLTLDRADVEPSMQGVKELLLERMSEVDRELLRLEEDALPERNKRCCPIDDQGTDLQMNEVETKPVMRDSGTGSSNILLTIPEEENQFTCDSAEHKHLTGSVRKPFSSRTVTRKKHYSKRTTADSVDFDSSPEMSSYEDSYEESLSYVRTDPIVSQKIFTMQKRISELLDEISFRLDRISAPDGERDLKRRQQRAMEFAIRFSRNYLYDLNRCILDIQRHVHAISPHAKLRLNRHGVSIHMHAIEQKLISGHQLLLHALTAYCKHIPSCTVKGHPGKLKELLQVVIDLRDICNEIQLTANYFESGDTNASLLGIHTEKKCNEILSKLKSASEKEYRPIVNKSHSSMTFVPESVYSKKCLSNRVNAYNVDTRMTKANNKKRTNICIRRPKYINDSKTHSTNYSSTPEQPYPSPVTQTSSKQGGSVETVKQRTIQCEDDIKTMMDIITSEFDNASSLEPQNRHSSTTVSKQKSKGVKKSDNLQITKGKDELRSSMKNENQTKQVTITEEQLSNLVPVIADLMSLVANNQNDVEVCPVSSTSVETLMEFLQKYQSPKNSDTKTTNVYGTCQSSTGASGKRSKSNSAKNMKLICVSSLGDTANQPRYCDASCQADCENLKDPSYSVLKNRKRAATRIRISESAEARFLQWKNEYQCFSQISPMYSSNTQNKPWDIVSWISDKLVDDLIVEIAKELQMDEVIQKLFELEFQEF